MEFKKVLTIVQKKLRSRLYNKGGRSRSGRITVFHRGSLNHRRSYRYINFISFNNVEAVVLDLFFDPNRTAKIALVYYLSGCCGYIIAAEGLKKGSTVFLGSMPPSVEDAFAVGSVLPLKLLPIGFVVHNIELEPSHGMKVCRSAGSFATILKKLNNKVLLKLNSGWNMWLHENCLVSLGVVSNSGQAAIYIKKAGLVRHMGFRPVVRGIAKNPVDHPHGGRSNKGQHPTTPWGRLTKGKPTVTFKKRLSKLLFRFK